MNIKTLLFLSIVWLPLLLLAQPPTERELGPNDFILLEKEPAPLNLNELKGMIGYPPLAKEAEIQGKVIIRVMVSEEGNYIKHVIIKDPHPILTEAVASKIHNLRFTPGIQNKKPIKVWVTIPFDFKLLSNEAPPAQGGLHLQTFYSLPEALACPDPAQVGELYLNDKQLKEFPMEILRFTNLRRLELGNNQLTSLPPEFAKLHELRVLGLSMNKFTALPPVLTVMPALFQINLKNNLFPKSTQKKLEKEIGAKLVPKDDKGNVVW